jgi:hypothetical protein
MENYRYAICPEIFLTSRSKFSAISVGHSQKKTETNSLLALKKNISAKKQNKKNVYKHGLHWYLHKAQHDLQSHEIQ